MLVGGVVLHIPQSVFRRVVQEKLVEFGTHCAECLPNPRIYGYIRNIYHLLPMPELQ